MNDTQLHEQFIEEPYTTEELIHHLQEKKLKLLSELNVVDQAIEAQKQRLKQSNENT